MYPYEMNHDTPLKSPKQETGLILSNEEPTIKSIPVASPEFLPNKSLVKRNVHIHKINIKYDLPNFQFLSKYIFKYQYDYICHVLISL